MAEHLVPDEVPAAVVQSGGIIACENCGILVIFGWEFEPDKVGGIDVDDPAHRAQLEHMATQVEDGTKICPVCGGAS